jgi:GAF domain-containing protein
LNSNAALEFGPVARTFSVPLRYALAVPILNGPRAVLGVISCYGSEPFDNDHQRIVESAATLFGASISTSLSKDQPKPADKTEKRDSRVH